ncbi:MAG: hypothetical protein ACOH1Y_11825 [Propionicimonas sp.]
MRISWALRDRAELSTSLVADPLGTENWIADHRVEPATKAGPDAVHLVNAWMEGSSTRLQREFFASDQIDKNKYTIWIIASLAAMVGISVVAGMGFLASLTALSTGLIPSTVMGMISPPLYVALLTVLTGAFVAILFIAHQAREPESHHPGIGFAGFVWNPEDGRE